MHRQYEREEDALQRELDEGRITPEEYKRELRELRRSWHDAAIEAAQTAYDREMEQW